MAEIKIWKDLNNDDECYYNVDKLLQFINSREKRWHHRLNAFTAALEKRVSIDKSDPKISPIYDGMDCIVKQIANGLKVRLPEIYSELEVFPTGSLTSGVKVGLPHEADFLFKLPNKIDKMVYKRETETRLSDLLCDDIASVIDDGIMSNEPGLRIHGIHRHKLIPGVCIVMSYGEDEDSRVGVTMDIVLVTSYHPTSPENLPMGMITSKSLRYIKDNDVLDYLKNSVYSLFDRSAMDTGILENVILSKLDDETKQGYRVAKYLVQLVHEHKRHNHASPDVLLDDTIDVSLYGFKPRLKSYHLRCMCLHLLTHVHKTVFAEQLKGGALALCLLDMLRSMKYRTNLPVPLTSRFVLSPFALIKDDTAIPSLINVLMASDIEDIDNLTLLNTDGIQGYNAHENGDAVNCLIPDNHIRIKLNDERFISFKEWQEDWTKHIKRAV